MFERTFAESIELVLPEPFISILSEEDLLEKVQEEILLDTSITGIPEDEPAEWLSENEPLAEWFLASLNLLHSDAERILFSRLCLQHAPELRKAEIDWLASRDLQDAISEKAREDLQSWGESQEEERVAKEEDYWDSQKDR